MIPLGFPGGSDGKASAYNVEDPGSIPGLGRSSGEGNGAPLQYFCLENPMHGGAWWATIYGISKSRTRLRNFTSPHLTMPLPFTLLFWVQVYTPFLCFLSREDPLAFVRELVWWC